MIHSLLVFIERLKKEDGLTLMELIISITLLAIIVLASFAGLQFAYYTMSSSDEFVESVYDVQGDLETDLSLVYNIQEDTNQTNVTLEETPDSVFNETIEFSWQSGTLLTDFKTKGIRVERSAQGGQYLDESIYIFVPVLNSDN